MDNDSIEEINNQDDETIQQLSISSITDIGGWSPKRKSDFIDIKLDRPIDIHKIVVVEGSNVESYDLTIVNEEDNMTRNRVIFISYDIHNLIRNHMFYFKRN